jgi:hypothetical protein
MNRLDLWQSQSSLTWPGIRLVELQLGEREDQVFNVRTNEV